MKSKSRLILVLLLVLGPAAILASAQPNNNLEWGVEPGEEYVYVLQRRLILEDAQESFVAAQIPIIAYLAEGQKAMANVTALDSIPSQIEQSEDMPIAYVSLRRENDSQIVLLNVTTFIVPINDWDFLTEIGEITVIEGLSLTETSEEWGSIASGSFLSGGVTVNFYNEIRFEKENGTLTYLRLRYTALGNDIVDIVFVRWLPGMPTVLPPELQLSTLMIIAIAGILGGVVAFASYKWFKNKKPLVQRLGE